ncbi:MAG TPA: fused MFS/spermidine synthase, partial [Opitutus sp.]|nr:fused MFS/spermidine synthase [Opitutus sp.]
MVQRASSRSDAPSPRFVKVIAPLLLFVSGAVALVYEVIWQRQFAVVFGSAAPATAAVLAAYFAGLGAGSWVVGRVAHRWTRPLRAYAILELFVGAGALLVRPLLEMLDALRPAEISAEAASLSSFAPRLAIAFLALLLPTFCMGGTLPLLGRFVDAGQRRLGVTAGWLYVANTMGAGLGALSVPFLLLPSMGVTHTVQVGVGINIGLAALAWWADLRSSELRVSPMKDAERAGRASDAAGRARGVLACALISGVVTFALQTLWNRAFAQVHENSMYSFAVIVAAVIVALALGAELARAGLRRGVPPKRLVGGAWMAGGAAVAIGPWLFWLLTGGLSYLPGDGGWLGHAAKLLGLALALLLAPMTLLGVGLPALME